LTEIVDFASALRQMADNAEALSERHDVADMAALRRQVTEQAVKAQRDGDLIDELRKQLQVMGRSLDAIGRMRKHVLAMKAPDAVQILAEALLVIGDRCASFMSPASCRTAGRVRGAKYGDEKWCDQCVARDALERAGALPREVD
jgi:hypothetical protein